MLTRRWLHVAVFSTALLSTPARAQTRPGDLDGNQVFATDLLGKEVRSDDNLKVGTIADLLDGPATGLVALLDAGARDGSAGGSTAMPLSRLRLGPERWLVADAAREEFRDAPSWARHRAKELLGSDLYGRGDSKIDAVKDLVVDPSSGQIVAAVVELAEAGSRAGSAGGHVAVPIGELRPGGGRLLATDLTRERLHRFPAINYRDDEN